MRLHPKWRLDRSSLELVDHLLLELVVGPSLVDPLSPIQYVVFK